MLNLLSVSGASYPGIDLTIFKFNVTNILQINTSAPPSTINKLPIPWHDLQETTSELSLLSWHTQLSDLFGYDEQIAELEKWATSDPAISVIFVTGPGGVGKSRLAAEYATRLSDNNWSAGYVNLRHPNSFPMSDEGTLLIIDYPEENKSGVKELLQDLAAMGNTSRLRILFLSRQTFDEWQEIIFESNAVDLAVEKPIHLHAIDNVAAHRIYNSALEKAADYYNTSPPPLSEDQISEWLQVASENDKPLFVIATALYSAQNPREEVVKYTGREIVEALADRELARLTRLAADIGCKDHCLFARLLAMAAIADELPISRIEELIKKPELHLQIPENINIESELKTSGIYKDRAIPAPKPDIVAAAFTVKVLSRRPEIAPELIWTALESNVIESFERISRLCYDAEFVLQIDYFKISDCLEKAILDQLDRCVILGEQLSLDPPICIIKTGISVWRTLSKNAHTEEDKAVFYNNLSVYLVADGNNDEALMVNRKAVDKYRILVMQDREKYQPELAKCLNNLSTQLFNTKDFIGALIAIREAVGIGRYLYDLSKERYSFDFAMTLHNLSTPLSHLGENDYSLEVSNDAVEILRELVNQEPSKYTPMLASSLINLSIRLAAVGDDKGATKAIREAVEYFRALVVQNPARYYPNLAKSLSNLATYRENPNALEDVIESIELYRQLTFINAKRFQPQLAKNIMIRGLLLRDLDRLPEAINEFKEGIRLIEPFIKNQPDSPYQELHNSLISYLDETQKAVNNETIEQ